MERFKNKKILIVGIGKTGFALINFFNRLRCDIRVTDQKPIFDLNKAVKKLKKLRPTPEMTFGEHRDEDFMEADVIIYCSGVNPHLPQLELARTHGKEVYGQFALAHMLCTLPIIAICGSYGRTTVANMIGHTLKAEGKNVFIGGTSDNPFINLYIQHPKQDVDYVIIEAGVLELQQAGQFKPKILIYTNIKDSYLQKRFKSYNEYLDHKLSVIKNLGPEDYLVVNFDALANQTAFRNTNAQVYWYSRRSFLTMGVMNEIQGTHFHERRIHSNIHYHSEFKVSSMKIVGEKNRENLLAAITACKALKISDKSIQACIEKFPGIPHRCEFIMEKNGVRFYNDSKSENMNDLIVSLEAFKEPAILIAGGKDTDQNYEDYFDMIESKVRVLVLVGECKERMNRTLGDASQTYLVGSFEESILIAYQKSRTGDVILLSPGNSSTDIFRDYEERGNYFKKLVYQL